MKKLIIIVEGGIVQEVIHNIEGLDLILLDGDLEGTTGEETQEFEGVTYYRYAGKVGEFDPKRAKNFKY